MKRRTPARHFRCSSQEKHTQRSRPLEKWMSQSHAAAQRTLTRKWI